MEIHERFIKFPTTGIKVLKTLAGNREQESQMIHELVVEYNKKISTKRFDLKTLKTFRKLLCYRYQLFVRSHNIFGPLKCKGRLYTNLRHIFIKNTEYLNSEEFSVLYDIAVLQLVYSAKPFFKLSFQDFWNTQGLLSSPENVDLAMRVSECFADSYNLHTLLFKIPDKSSELETELNRILTIIQLWLKKEEPLEWKLLTSLLPKLIVTFKPEEVISSLWDHLFGSLKILPPFAGKEISVIPDIEKKLSVLCVMADVCFPTEREKVQEFHYKQCLQNEFWCILNRGLINKHFQYRKQALYLMRRALVFIDMHTPEIIRRLEPLQNSAMPFVRTKPKDDASSLEEIKQYLFLILEVLEEKQKHLILPVLSYLQSLVEAQADTESCFDCFNPLWLRCVYRRIVQHDNDAVKTLGLQNILKSDSRIFLDDEFVSFFIDALNNTLLYEYNDDEEKPQIVKELEASFLRWEQKKITLINSFVRQLPSVSWSPVALYWIVQALLTVSHHCTIVTNVWESEELHCVEKVIEKILKIRDQNLQIFSHVLIIQTLMAYTSMPVNPTNFECIFNMLCSFSENGYLALGGKNWIDIAEHMSVIIKRSDAVQYVIQRCEEMFTVTYNLESFARTIYLLADAELIFVENHCLAENALHNLFTYLVEVNVNPDADEDIIRKVVKFFGHLMSPNNSFYDKTLSEVKIDKVITPYINAVSEVVCNSLEEKTISKYDEYVFFITALLNKEPQGVIFTNWIDQWNRIKNSCITIITNPHKYCRTQWSYAIKVLETCCLNARIESEELFGFSFIPLLMKYFISGMIDIGQEENVVEEKSAVPKGEFASHCPGTIARILEHFFKRSSSELWSLELDWMGNLKALVQTGNEDVISPVTNILQIVLAKHWPIACNDFDILISIIRISWIITFQLEESSRLRFGNFYDLTQLVTCEGFLKVEGYKEYTLQCIDQMIREGERVPSFKEELLNVRWNVDRIGSRAIFMSCLFHGVLPRRHERIERTAISHGYQLCNNIQSLFVDTTMAIRKSVINFILKLSDNPKDQDIILKNLLEFLEQNKNKRYTENSELHRFKLRVMQTLLVQEPILNESQRQRLHDVLCDLLIAESNLTSVRLMHEWLLIRLCLKNAGMRRTMWKLFDTAAEKQPGSLVSLASITFHVARLLAGKTQREYIVEAISQLLPNCMSQQFEIRLYSQAILVKIYEMLPSYSSEAASQRNIFESMKESLHRGNLMKNFKSELGNFYFTIFDPVLDFNMETIYYTLPRLTNVSPDEFMSDLTFETAFYNLQNNICLEFAEGRDSLWTAKPSAKSSKLRGKLEAMTYLSTDSTSSDIQPRVIPWKSSVPFYDDLSEVFEARRLRRKREGEEAGIIVVASLINRPPILGQIARTCDIFGVEELVIGSLKYAEDFEFRTLSVSAERWITMTEVKAHLLQTYLMEKQSEGWKLVGADHTENSTNLLKMVFPEKTILLLGNEKDGIPANLISLMDTCVEIPQIGVVSSLNVHITGALCIWQYAEQHIFT